VFVKEEDFGGVPLACVSILERLHGGTSSGEALIIDGEAKLEFSVAEKASRLVLFCVKHVNLHFLNGVALSCEHLTGSYL
jgi:hypothetical protein